MLRHLLGLLPSPVVLGNLSKDEFRHLFGGGELQGHLLLTSWLRRMTSHDMFEHEEGHHLKVGTRGV